MNFPPLISANRNQWGPLGASFMHSRKVLPKQNGSRLRDYSRGYLRFCSSPCFHLGMPSKSQTVLKAAAGADTHRKITVILSHTFKMDMPNLILGREVLPLVSFRFPVHPYPYIYSINFVLIMSMKYVNYTVVASGIMYASWLNIPASFFKKYARFW